MIKCSFCDARAPSVCDKKIKDGWGLVTLYTQDIHMHMIHCPEHFDEFAEVLRRQLSSKKEKP